MVFCRLLLFWMFVLASGLYIVLFLVFECWCSGSLVVSEFCFKLFGGFLVIGSFVLAPSGPSVLIVSGSLCGSF